MTERIQGPARITASVMRTPGSGKPARPKELVVPHTSFEWLKRFAAQAPGPRLDLRAYAEGAVHLLVADPGLRESLVLEAKTAMFKHVGRQLGPEILDDLRRELSAGQPEASDQPSSRERTNFRTVAPSGAHEGAAIARTQGQVQAPAEVDPPCKALHVGETTFAVLQDLQGASRDPRVGLRYWLEGAVRLLQQREDLHVDWVRHARTAMQMQLQELQQ